MGDKLLILTLAVYVLLDVIENIRRSGWTLARRVLVISLPICMLATVIELIELIGETL